MDRVRLEFVEGNSSKQYIATRDRTRFTAQWGRIGAALQRKDFDFPSDSMAHGKWTEMIQEKKNKGYRVVESNSHMFPLGYWAPTTGAPKPKPQPKPEPIAPAATGRKFRF